MAPGPLAAALQSHDMFLYFGHGSGDQYLSARYRTTDYVTFYYQLHPLHSYLLFREQCCAKGAAQLLCVLQWKPATHLCCCIADEKPMRLDCMSSPESTSILTRLLC